MGKNKNQNRERAQAPGKGTAGSGQEPDGTAATVDTRNEVMPSMSPNMSRKRGKKFGHN